MSGPTRLRRRTFLAGSAGALGLALLRPVPGFATSPIAMPAATRIIFDPAQTHSVQFGLAARDLGAICKPLSADRYRFIQALLADNAPAAVAGVSSFDDFVMLSGALQEAGYRLSGHGVHRPSEGQHMGHGDLSPCTAALHRSRDAWPAALARWILTEREISNSPTPRRAACPAGGTSVMSWSMKTRSIPHVS
jgi:hypothetical protein